MDSCRRVPSGPLTPASQLPTPNTTRPWSMSTTGDDHTLPQPWAPSGAALAALSGASVYVVSASGSYFHFAWKIHGLLVLASFFSSNLMRPAGPTPVASL